MVKVSKKNKDLAKKIVTQTGNYVNEPGYGHRVDLVNMGIFTTPFYKTKDEATDDMAARVAEMLENGELQLSDTWEKDNLDK